MTMYLYIITSPLFRSNNIIKLGSTEDPHNRLSTYLTGFPPIPFYDINYVIIFETNAPDRETLYNYEDILHNQFIEYRMMRRILDDSEWFSFGVGNPSGIERVRTFMKGMPWVIREVFLSDIPNNNDTNGQFKKHYHKNTAFIRSPDIRKELLEQRQQPIIDTIRQFIKNQDVSAGYIVAPCGSGKTLMACRGSKDVRKLVVCCPSNKIQRQWIDCICSESMFTTEQILMIGSEGTTSEDEIKSFMSNEIYCVITTYMSSSILVNIVSSQMPQLIILDEAHHVAGIVGKEDEGEGKTRRLMAKASELKIKRLSLTFTPRIIKPDDTDTDNKTDTGTDTDNKIDIVKYLTMDDATIFGSMIAELKIRDMINLGILPDYRIWSLYDKMKKSMGIIGKAECILEAWNSKEVIHGMEQYVLHHLIVFAYTNEEAKQLETYFRQKTKNTSVFCVKGGDSLTEPLRKFTEAKRAIIVNCKVLGEGVDIPIANAVAVTYPKRSHGEITQMLLRAGRWYKDKPLFHILFPILDGDDMSSFEEVLVSLASCDERICDEITLRAVSDTLDGIKKSDSISMGSVVPGCIVMENYNGANVDEIRQCFANVRKVLFSAKDYKRIRELCIEKGIHTSLEYYNFRQTINPDLPEDPKLKNQLWYDFLHPTSIERIDPTDFVRTVVEENDVRVADAYEIWRSMQPSGIIAKLPSIQHIIDGYFGKENTNFNDLVEKFKTIDIDRDER